MELAGHADIRTTYKYSHAIQKRININGTNIFDNFSKEALYKDGKDILSIPIEHIASIVIGKSDFSKIDELKITLEEISGKTIDFFNISNIIEECKNYITANYPSLGRLEKYKYTKQSNNEIMEKIKKEFGKDF